MPGIEGWFRTESTVRVLVATDEARCWLEEGETYQGWELIHVGERHLVLGYEIYREEWGPLWIVQRLAGDSP